jgi:hypothetical protein
MSGRTNNVIRLAVSNQVLTSKEMTQFDFEAIPEFVDFQNNFERAKTHSERLQQLSIATHFAIIVLSRSKSELIELVKSMDDDKRVGSAELYRGLIRGQELAAAILGMMTAAEMRVAATQAV